MLVSCTIIGASLAFLPMRAQLGTLAAVAVGLFVWHGGGGSLLLLAAVPIRVGLPLFVPSASVLDLALPIAFVRELTRLHPARRPKLMVLPFLVGWLLVTGLVTAYVGNWFSSVVLLGEMLIGGATMYMWGRAVGTRRAWRRWVLLGAFSCVAAVVWYTVLRKAEALNFHTPRSPDEALAQEIRLGSPFWGPSNFVASLLLLFVPMTAAFRQINSAARVCLTLLGSSVIVLTLSRGGILALLLGFAFAAVADPRVRRSMLRRPRWLLASAPVVLALLLWGNSVLQRAAEQRRLSGSWLEDPVRGRLFREGLRHIAEKPVLGHGYGSWPALEGGSLGSSAHNYFLQISVESGLVGAVLFIAFFVVLFLRARALPGADGTRFGAMATLMAVAVNIALEASFEGVLFSLLFAMFVGLVLASESTAATAVPHPASAATHPP